MRYIEYIEYVKNTLYVAAIFGGPITLYLVTYAVATRRVRGK